MNLAKYTRKIYTSENSLLGKETNYPTQYCPEILQGIKREGCQAPHGLDRWNCYEVSWLNPKGKPERMILTFDVPISSPKIIESKSLKLYLNGFNFEKLTKEDLLSKIKKDLSQCCGEAISFCQMPKIKKAFINLDLLDTRCRAYSIDKSLLQADQSTIVEEQLKTDNFRSTCPVTNQPDWASIYITYKGPKLNPESLLQYLVSFRKHQGFHENCVDIIYKDLDKTLSADHLIVEARFERRGGIDINPIRSKINISGH